MSKLYDVISRLEDAAEQEAKGFETPLPEFEEKPRRFQSPNLRVLLFSLLLVILGSFAVGLTAWWQNWLVKQEVTLFSKNVPIQQEQDEQQAHSPAMETAAQSSFPSDTNTIVQPTGNIMTRKKTESIPNNQPPVITDKLLPDTMVVDVGVMDRTVETIDDFLKTRMYDQVNPTQTTPLKNARIYIHDLDIAEAVVDEELPSIEETTPPSQSTNINASKAKTSRWLHQAELYRHNGEWAGAIALYQRVWDISGEPDVANNLAAALMQTNRLEEAVNILLEASKIAPDDPDIKDNLNILQQLLSKK